MKVGKGDSGYTDRLNGSRVKKNHPSIELIGELDELSAWIGLFRSEIPPSTFNENLEKIQEHLSTIMTVISSSTPEVQTYQMMLEQNLLMIENWLAQLEEEIEIPHHFLFAGKNRRGALLNLLRVISRRIERKAVAFLSADNALERSMMIYLNRLSTLFYFLWLQTEKDSQ